MKASYRHLLCLFIVTSLIASSIQQLRAYEEGEFNSIVPPKVLRDIPIREENDFNPDIISMGYSPYFVGTIALACGGALLTNLYLKTPQRQSVKDSNDHVGQAYDQWTQDGIIEAFWGPHFHLGYFDECQLNLPGQDLDMKEGALKLVDRMIEFGFGKLREINGIIVDVGCGVGGTLRRLKEKFPNVEKFIGINISPIQVAKAKEHDDGIDYLCMDAMKMNFSPESIDVFWLCESTEHMNNKEGLFENLCKALKPGGKIILAAWNRRENSLIPYSERELYALEDLCSQWAHSEFVTGSSIIQEFRKRENFHVEVEDWTKYTKRTWSLLLSQGQRQLTTWIYKPWTWYRFFRDVYCVRNMYKAFDNGLLCYNVFKITKLY